MIQRRFSFLALLAVLALVLSAFFALPGTAQAQDADPDNEALPYPGPFSDPADDTAADEVLSDTVIASDFIGGDAGDYFTVPDLVPSSDPAAAVAAQAGGTGGGLAVTGSEVEPIAAISVGLLALGGSVLVSSRRRLRDYFS